MTTLGELKRRLREEVPMTTIRLRMPEDVVNHLNRIATALGFSGHLPLLRGYIGQGLRQDLERLEGTQHLAAASSGVQLLDVVALTGAIPARGLGSGQVGTVVEILDDGLVFEVEFSDREGRTYESLALRPEQFLVLRCGPPAKEGPAPEALPASAEEGRADTAPPLPLEGG